MENSHATEIDQGIADSHGTGNDHQNGRRATGFPVVLAMAIGVIVLGGGLLLSGVAVQIPSADQTSVGLAVPLQLQEVNTGGSLLSTSAPANKAGSLAFQEINMTVDRYGWDPDKFTVVKGVPVRWNIRVKELTSCNRGISAPSLGIDYVFQSGGELKTFEFTPNEVGTIPFTCWMGMIPGSITVKEAGASPGASPGSGTVSQESSVRSTDGIAVLSIRGMCCGGCANKIKNAVSSMGGVSSAKIEFPKGEGTVNYDPSKVTADQIAAKINSIGYQAKII